MEVKGMFHISSDFKILLLLKDCYIVAKNVIFNMLVSGIWDLFDYDHHSLPYKIHNQPDPDELCLEITEDMDLVFTFLPPAEKNAKLVWRYTNILSCIIFFMKWK